MVLGDGGGSNRKLLGMAHSGDNDPRKAFIRLFVHSFNPQLQRENTSTKVLGWAKQEYSRYGIYLASGRPRFDPQHPLCLPSHHQE